MSRLAIWSLLPLVLLAACKHDDDDRGKAIASLTFEDPLLAQCIAESGVDYAGDLFSLDCALRAIESAGGIDQLTYLNQLYLSRNRISDLTPLADLSLGSLELADNLISDVDALGGMSDLYYLRLESNLIADIAALDGLTGVSHLNLGDNQLVDISALANMQQMQGLELYENEIEDISALAGMGEMHFFQAYQNKISDLGPLSSLASLTVLELWDNDVTEVSALSGLTQLEQLNLGGMALDGSGGITDVAPLAGLGNLRWLNLDQNSVADLTPLVQLGLLEDLSLADNDLSDVTEVVELAQLSQLRRLDLANNTFVSDVWRLVEFTTLEKLNLSGNWQIPCDDVDALVDALGDVVSPPETCHRPIADPGPPLGALVNDTVWLDGSNSGTAWDDNGWIVGQEQIETWAWTLVELPPGSSTLLNNPDAVNPSLVPDMAGSYTVELVVNDGTGDSLPATTSVWVE